MRCRSRQHSGWEAHKAQRGTWRSGSASTFCGAFVAVMLTFCLVGGVDAFPPPDDRHTGKKGSGKPLPTLWEAARDGNEEAVYDCLESGSKVDGLDENGWPALHWAARNGHVEVMEMLMEAGANPNARLTSNGTTAMMWAACENRSAAVKLLIESGADVNMRDDNLRWIALHWAATTDVNITSILLDAGSDVSIKGRDGTTALHLAAAHGRDDCARVLLSAGAVVGVQDTHRMTALHLAAVNGHSAVAKYLAECGADINSMDEQCTPLHYAAALGDASLIEALLAAGADPNKKGDIHKTAEATPLHVAAKADSPEAVAALLKGGAWANLTLAPPPFGSEETPLHVSAWRGFNGVVRVLLNEGGADVNATTSHGATAIDFAAERGHLDTVRELEAAGAVRREEGDGAEGKINVLFGMAGGGDGGFGSFAERLMAGASKEELGRFKRANSTIKFEDVAGCDEAKEELEDVVAFLREPERFTRLGGRMNRGILLSGPPGTGKTLLAKAVAGEAGVPFIFTSGSEFDEVYAGLGAARVRELFAEARKQTPCIVFIDEIDAVGSSRTARADRQDARQTLNQILAEMDGFATGEGVLILAATNMPEVLDSALLRPGRFDRKVHVSRPDQKGRAEIFKVHLRNVTVETGVDVEILARGTPGFTGADIMNMVNTAALEAAKDGKDAVTLPDLEAAKDRLMMGMERRSARVSEEAKLLTAYHESGHALVAALTAGARQVHKVTIVPRGRALGMVMQLPNDDEMGRNRGEYLASIAVCMGGRAAEELVYGGDSVTDGCSSDLEQATELATVMVERFGMGRKAGVVSHGVDQWRSMQRSEILRSELDGEVKEIVSAAMQDAMRLLRRHKRLLHALAKELVERGTLTGGELNEFLTQRGVATSGSSSWTTAHARSHGLLARSIGPSGGAAAMVRHLATKVMCLREAGTQVWEGCVDGCYGFLMGRGLEARRLPGRVSAPAVEGAKEGGMSAKVEELESQVRALREMVLELRGSQEQHGKGQGSQCEAEDTAGDNRGGEAVPSFA